MVGSSPQSTLFEGYEMFDDTSSYMNDIVSSSIHIYSIPSCNKSKCGCMNQFLASLYRNAFVGT